MKFVNRMLQNAGAFYIRRSFGHDQLYWSAVSEYIQYHINNFQAPIEFFLEGTRSRNGKSLSPKTGKMGLIFIFSLVLSTYDLFCARNYVPRVVDYGA